ncbi:MAG: hypothetical protein Q9170_006078 [Blastenia crenularia]
MEQIPVRGAENPYMVTAAKFQHPHVFSLSHIVRGGPDGFVPGTSSLRTEGEIQVKISDRPSSEQSIWVENEIRSHDLSLIHTARNENGVTITTPSVIPLTDNIKDPYISIKATIWISRGLPLSSFYIGTFSLPINIPHGVPVRSSTPIHISAPSSSVCISSLSSSSPFLIDARSTTLTATSGSVQGDFTLRDSLSIHTTSGSINIDLSLLPSKSNTTTPATLDLKSNSGSINVRTSTISSPHQIPDRDYRSTLRSNSGSLTASLVHGSLTDLKSDNGRIQASLYPHGNASVRSDISAHTLSGRQDITVHPSLTNSSAPLREFYAQYHGISGSMRVEYPAQWEGTVEGSTVSGSIGVAWPGLKIVKDESGWGRHKLMAVKGTEGKGVLGFKDVSGRVDLRGEEAVVRLVAEDEEVSGCARAAETETETETGTEAGEQIVLTPQSEAGDEWLMVQ